MHLETLGSGSNKYIASDEREDYLIYARGGNDTVVGNDGNDTIYGEAGKDIVKGGGGDDLLSGGTGNDTLTGGDGEDIFIYANGDGNDVITDYIAGEDKIQFTSGTPKFKVNGSDVVITVGTGKITVKGAADRVITYIDANGRERSWPNTIDIDDDTNTVKLAKGYARDSFNLTGYDDDLQTVDASAVTHDLAITGNAKANKIIGTGEDDTIDGGAGKDTVEGGDGNDVISGGKGNDSLYGGAGNDTLTGGSGSDIFVYAKGTGKDVITDYAEEDKINFTTGTTSELDISTNGDDVIFKFSDNHKVTVKDAASKTISYIVNGQELTWSNDTVEYNSKKTSATLLSNYNDDEYIVANTPYAKTLKNIDASAVENDLVISANKLANKIIGTSQDDSISSGAGADSVDGGAGNDTIIGGTGNDTLTGGSGADVFVYRSGDGNDIITDYSNEDMISIASGSVKGAYLSGDNYILTVGTGKITVQGVEGKYLHVFDSAGEAWYPDTPPNPAGISSSRIILTEGFFDDSLDINTYTRAARFKDSIVTIDASAVDHGIGITANKKNNVIVGTSDDDYIDGGAGKDTINAGDGNDSILGGKGNDVLTGGEGADVFIYRNGDGNDRITDYDEEDIIQFTSGTAKAKTVGDNVVFTLGKGKITVTGGKNHVITYEDAGGEHTYPAKVVTLNSAGTAATLLSNYRGTVFDATTSAFVSDYADILKTINGSLVTHDIEITGNAKANRIIGGTEDDTIYGGKGNDTLTGGTGEDVFVYNSGDGKDVITDYAPGEDVINFATGTVSSVGKSGNDVVFKVGSGSVTVKNAKNKIVTYIEGDEEKTYPAGSSRPYTVSSDGESVTLASTYTTRYGNSFDVTDFDDMSNVRRIDATKVDADLTVKGNNKNNLIYCSGGDNTIYGGKGNDTINGGEGDNLYVYSSGDGNDLIVDWGSSDSISIASGNLSGDFRSTDDTVILTVGKGKISLQGAVGEQLNYWYDGEAHHTIVGANANVLEDDNFITSNDLSSLVEDKAVDYSAAQASDITALTKSSNALPAVNYSKKK